LVPILLVVFIRRFDQHLLIHECIAVVVDPHDAIQRMDEGPIECRPKPLYLILECVESWPDLQIP
jgi:hypothetical protein